MCYIYQLIVSYISIGCVISTSIVCVILYNISSDVSPEGKPGGRTIGRRLGLPGRVLMVVGGVTVRTNFPKD